MNYNLAQRLTGVILLMTFIYVAWATGNWVYSFILWGIHLLDQYFTVRKFQDKKAQEFIDDIKKEAIKAIQ